MAGAVVWVRTAPIISYKRVLDPPVGGNAWGGLGITAVLREGAVTEGG